MTLYDREIGRETYAVIRFGLGYPALGAPQSADAILERLHGPDTISNRFPALSFSQTIDNAKELVKARRARRKNEMSEEDYKKVTGKLRRAANKTVATDFARAVETDDPFRERLQMFWSNHFALLSKGNQMDSGPAGFSAEAIRPHLAGSFGDLLKSAVLHPMMILYLDQSGSIGPNSQMGKKKGRGLNENLAREILELHTLGVQAGYTQADVTQLAELLTGVNFSLKDGFRFRPVQAEPGAETILGKSYGGTRNDGLADIHAALDDLAVHPSTAQHISLKLATYFVADRPDPGLVKAMTTAFLQSQGWLPDVYAAMLNHPAAWSGFGTKIKWPFEYMATSMRAIGVTGEDLYKIPHGQVRKHLLLVMGQMGQKYRKPLGPDGWPDYSEAWIHPHGVAARVQWAMGVAQRFRKKIPQPTEFVSTALGDAATARLEWAARVAESRAEGVGVVLASAEFNRR